MMARETLLPQLQDPQARYAVIEAVLALFARWRLHEINQAELLGVADIRRLKRQNGKGISSTVLARAGNLLAIDRALKRYYAYQPRRYERWISTPQRQLNGETPLAVMLEQGDSGIEKVRDMVESEVDAQRF